MHLKKLIMIGSICTLASSPAALAQETAPAPTCDDIEWSSTVTDEYPNIADACNSVLEKNGAIYARVQVELLRVSGRTLTFKMLNADGTTAGNYSQTVDTSWRANIGGREYRPRDLSRGQMLNVYMPGDRWAVIHEDEDGPDAEDLVPLELAPMLPKTATVLPLLAGLGGGLMLLGAALGWVRRRF